jgi:hypothetical protein
MGREIEKFMNKIKMYRAREVVSSSVEAKVHRICRQSAQEGDKFCQLYSPAVFSPRDIFLVLICITG